MSRGAHAHSHVFPEYLTKTYLIRFVFESLDNSDYMKDHIMLSPGYVPRFHKQNVTSISFKSVRVVAVMPSFAAAGKGGSCPGAHLISISFQRDCELYVHGILGCCFYCILLERLMVAVLGCWYSYGNEDGNSDRLLGSIDWPRCA